MLSHGQGADRCLSFPAALALAGTGACHARLPRAMGIPPKQKASCASSSPSESCMARVQGAMEAEVVWIFAISPMGAVALDG